MKNKVWIIASLVLIIAAGLLPFLFWYEGGEIIAGADYTVALDPPLYFQRLFYAWLPNINGGAEIVSHGPATAFYQGILALGFLLTNSLIWAQKIMLCFWIALPGISMLFLAKYLVRKYKWPGIFIFFSVLIYLFNLYHTIQFQDAAHLATYSVLPLAILFIFKGLWERKDPLLYSFLLGILAIVGSIAGINPPMFLVFFGIIAILVIGYFTYRRPRDQILKTNLRFLILAAIICILFCAYWLIPFAYNYGAQMSGSSDLASQNLVDWLGGVSRETSLLNNSRLIGAWDWYSGYNDEAYIPYANNYFTNPFLLIASVFLPALALGALLVKRRNKFILFALIISLIGILFASGTHDPFGHFYEWMADNIPLFWIFRSPWYKFSLMIAFGYAIASAFTLAYIYQHCRNRVSRPPRKNFLSALMIVGVIIFVAGYNYPFLTGEKYPREQDYEVMVPFRVHLPDYAKAAANYVNEEGSSNRIANLPPLSAFNYSWNFSGITDATFYLMNSDNLYREDVVGTATSADSAGKVYDTFVTELINHQPGARPAEILKILATDKILQKNDMLWDFYGELYAPELMKEKLARVEEIKTDKSFGAWDFYAYEENFPRIYATDTISEINGNIETPARLTRARSFGDSETFIFADDTDNLLLSPTRFIEDKKITCQNTDCEVSGWEEDNGKLRLTKQDNLLRIPFTMDTPNENLYLGLSAIPEQVKLSVVIDETGIMSEKVDLTGKGTKEIPLDISSLNTGSHTLVLRIQRQKNKSRYNLEFSGLNILSEQIFGNDNNGKLPAVDFERISPVKYNVSVSNASSPYLLVFQENFNPNWKVYINGEAISENNHLKVNGYANAWLIEAEGSYTIRLFYWPQKLLTYSLYISGLSIGFMLVVLTISSIKKRFHAQN